VRSVDSPTPRRGPICERDADRTTLLSAAARAGKIVNPGAHVAVYQRRHMNLGGAALAINPLVATAAAASRSSSAASGAAALFERPWRRARLADDVFCGGVSRASSLCLSRRWSPRWVALFWQAQRGRRSGATMELLTPARLGGVALGMTYLFERRHCGCG
jgi:hypothetical protein